MSEAADATQIRASAPKREGVHMAQSRQNIDQYTSLECNRHVPYFMTGTYKEGQKHAANCNQSFTDMLETHEHVKKK
eukprot:144424-Pelagomonas_calceolata.AAC.1